MDEHATQTLPQEWWSTTFKDAIREIGRTAIMLSPWDQPVTLTRAWCLWEIYCTLEVGAVFTTCFGGGERRKFEGVVSTQWQAVDKVFSRVDVANAEAGSPDDLTMIMNAIDMAGGPMCLNTLVMKHMQSWVLKMANWTINKATTPTGGIFPSSMAPALNVGTLFHSRNDFNSAMRLYQQTCDVASTVVVPGTWDRPARWASIARNRMAQIHFFKGENAKARECFEEILKTKIALLGADHPEVLKEESGLAMVFGNDKRQAEARELYEHVLKGYASLGPLYEKSLDTARLNFGNLLINMKDFDAARKKFELVVESRQRRLGPNHLDTLQARSSYGKVLFHLHECAHARRELEAAIEGLTA